METTVKTSQRSYKELLGVGAGAATIVVAMESQPANATTTGLDDLSTTVTTAGTIVTALSTTAAVVVGFVLVANYIMKLMKST